MSEPEYVVSTCETHGTSTLGDPDAARSESVHLCCPEGRPGRPGEVYDPVVHR